eukprot:TRINITY_DN93669_c0_g1_i1.p1 TRINITY_DN93669_c0_g1~~TRINITY_DN93669_c0_g1_i1.p1  ORF type:complete len:207 (-),score=21.84 TRINITY_DN93669_c0_g1_i1:418-1038(-)
MLQWAAPFLAGFACRSHFGALPCSAHWKGTTVDRPYKLSIIIQSAVVGEISGQSGFRGGCHTCQDQRPYVVVRVGDKIKETELGDWSSEKQQWLFHEVITVEVMPTDKLFLAVSSTMKYDFGLWALQLSSRQIGEACFQLASLLPQLKPKDPKEGDIFRTTSVMPLDVWHEGTATANVYLSFETCEVSPAHRKGNMDNANFRSPQI